MEPQEAKVRGNRIYLIDTPGFEEDGALKQIANWLSDETRPNSHESQSWRKVTGIIYLHRITDNRMNSTAVRNLEVFHKLVGDNYLKTGRVVFATTMWDLLEKKDDGVARQDDLRKKYCAVLNRQGMEIIAINGKTAGEVVGRLMEKKGKLPRLDIQEEMVGGKAKFEDTAAAKHTLTGEVGALKAEVERLGGELNKEKAEVSRLGGELARQEEEVSRLEEKLKNEKAEVERVIIETMDKLEKLKKRK